MDAPDTEDPMGAGQDAIQDLTERLQRLAAFTEDLIKAAHAWPDRFAALVESEESDWRWQVDQIVTGDLPLSAQSFGANAQKPWSGEVERQDAVLSMDDLMARMVGTQTMDFDEAVNA